MCSEDGGKGERGEQEIENIAVEWKGQKEQKTKKGNAEKGDAKSQGG